METKRRLYLPDLLYADGEFRAGIGLLVDAQGEIEAVGDLGEMQGAETVRLSGRALLPGLVNGHSHTFQRLIRGVAEHAGPDGDDFWAWRHTMYRAAAQLSPEELFDVARMAFLEMALNGITSVGEFHYVHRQPDGTPYPDPNLLSKRVIEAAESVGVRICLLRVAYERAGFDLPPNPGQRRFYEECEEFLQNTAALLEAAESMSSLATVGVAPHSIRAVPAGDLERIVRWAETRALPIHMHVSEQRAELRACEREYGVTPVHLLEERRLLSDRLTLVHAIHTSGDEVEAMAAAKTTICSCPTTERNLGDGILDAKQAMQCGIPISFGTDSQANINLLEDARELDYHLRLQRERRVLLDGIEDMPMANRLFACATENGARSLGLNVGALEPGRKADFLTVALDDVTLAGASHAELLSTIIFASDRAAIRDVVVDGTVVIGNGRHGASSEIVSRYAAVAKRLSSTA